MKLISDIDELKKGDTIIVKDSKWFDERGLARVTGDIYSIDKSNFKIQIQCVETDSIEEFALNNSKVFLIS